MGKKKANLNIDLIDLIREAEEFISNGLFVEVKKIRMGYCGFGMRCANTLLYDERCSAQFV